MSGSALEVREPGARYFVQSEPALIRGFDLLATGDVGIKRLRGVILELSIKGNLVAQSSQDEGASALVELARKSKGLATSRKTSPTNSLRIASDSLLPVGWCWSSLSEIGLISPRNQADGSTTASFVQMSSIPIAMLDHHLTESRPWRDIRTGFTHFAEGDVGVAKITPCFENGKSTVFRRLEGRIGAGTTELHIVRPLGGVLPEYILVFLKSPAFLRNGEAVMTGSAGQKRLPRAYFEGTPFPLPPLAEQRRIVARVEELMKLCDALEQSGRLADEQHARLTSALFDALAASESAHALAENWQRIAEHFDLLLDRPEAIAALEQTILQLAVRGLLVPQDSRDALDDGAAVSLGDAGSIRNEADDVNPELPTSWSRVSLGSITRDLRYGTSAKCAYESVGAPVLRIPNLCSGRVLVSDLKFGALSADEVRRLRLEVGDLLIIRSNGSASLVGSAAIVGKEAYGFAFAGYLMRLRLREEWATPSFVLLTLETAAVRSQIERPLRTTSGVKNINSTEVANIRLSLPPLAEQHRIVARVEELRLLCTQLRERLSDARRTQSQLADALVAEVLA